MAILRLPSEVACFILESCNGSHDALALASSCKHWYNEWMSHGPLVLCKFWKTEIACFDEALIAVGDFFLSVFATFASRHNLIRRILMQTHATQLVLDSEARGVQPPTAMDFSLLREKLQRPSLKDMSAVWALSRVVKAMCVRMSEMVEERTCGLSEELELLEYLPECYARMERATYRILIAGAALAGLYNQPTFKADPAITPYNFTPADADRIQRFFAFQKMSSPESYEAAFGSFAAWLRQDILSKEPPRLAMTALHKERRGRGLCCLDRRREYYDSMNLEPDSIFYNSCILQCIDKSSHADTHLVIWETMQMLWVAGSMPAAIYNDPSFPHDTDVNSKIWQVPIIPFGEFQPVMFHLSRDATRESPHKYRYRAVRPPPIEVPNSFYKQICKVEGPMEGWDGVGRWLDDFSGQPNRYVETDCPVTPLKLKLFDYLLLRFANARLSLDFFTNDWEEHWFSYMTFTDSFTIFASDEPQHRHPFIVEVHEGEFSDGSEMLIVHRNPTTYYHGNS
ncbi:hypothetical protein NQ176_g2445 [Zarea fungicola]|uniref:Uncharacterized protein n=1 Tax=Zarea fungicola TaxID=93591 RepID=A0ACC1NNW3_9HYPO|nr:hypothetical protein NQ176_g2445 [Lecanicillium fungicola]